MRIGRLAMADQVADTTSAVRPGRRTARRLVENEAYRRITTGEVPETVSEFAAQLSAWFKDAYPIAPPMPASVVEEAIRDTWHRRHEIIGSEL
jgi:hypothetical protein